MATVYFNSPQLACFFFGMATMTRSTGVLLSIFIAFSMGNKFLRLIA